MPTTSATTIRPIREDELPAWFEAFGMAFYIWARDPHEMAEARRPNLQLDRAIGAFEGDTIVGTFRTFASRLTLPGGARIPVNAVSGVSVRPTHRRRGTLTAMIADDVARAAARGDAASILIASEWPIYGRYGYGPATITARWSVRVRAAQLRVEPTGTVESLRPDAARQQLPELYDRYAAGQPGEIEREAHRWDYDLGLREFPGRPRWSGTIAVHRAADGELDAYARYHGEEAWEEGIPDNVLVLDELHGVDVAAELQLWRYLLQMDLTATIRAENRREHEPLPWFLVDARAARLTQLHELLWVRVLDVERVLGERRYERDGDVVVEVRDVVGGKDGPAAGRFRLTATGGIGTCRRTDEAAALSIDVRSLSAAVLGGTRLVDASRIHGPVEQRPGALLELDALLRTADEPWCTTWF